MRALQRGARRVELPAATPHSWPALWAAVFQAARQPMLVIVPRPEDAVSAATALAAYLGGASYLVEWRAHDSLPYEHDSNRQDTSTARLRVLERLSAQRGGPLLVVTSVKALLEPTLSPVYYRGNRMQVAVGQRLDIVGGARRLASMGYMSRSLVEVPGTFSRRGDILDVWPSGSERPFRIELFGDDVESLRAFDPVTQRSESDAQQAVIGVPTELPLAGAGGALARLRELDVSGLRQEVRADWDRTLLDVEEHVAPPAVTWLAPFFSEGMHSLLDYLPAGCVLAPDSADRLGLVAAALDAQTSELRIELESQGELPRGVPRPWLEWRQIETQMDAMPRLVPPEEQSAAPLTSGVNGFGGNVERILARLRVWLVEGKQVVLITRQSDRMRHLLAEHGLPTAHAVAANGAGGGRVVVVNGVLPEGWASEQLRLVVLSDGELWGFVERMRKPVPRRYRTPTFLADLQVGGYVVHVDHGIARYVGTVRRGAAGAEREYLLLEYAGGDKLYVPVDQVDRISPYVGAGGAPALSRLGTADWAHTKRRVRRAAEELARELLKVHAARAQSPGFAFSPDGTYQNEFESAFGYTETEDQLLAINEVKADMEASGPMDRLVCGDVGYGKTEVALRAAFKAVMDGKQVAVLVPTTVLALQHFETFRQRFAMFPVQVEMLSRLRNKHERDAIVEGLRTGRLDIVIGTHRLLQKDVQFKDLGLLVVDEEQRFGVRHKELLKQLRAEVDVLTMTATPIPRTLQMALAGVRDMTVIETPPDNRLPIRTFVTPMSRSLVREVILREIDRGGQAYYVHNRVQDIYRVASELGELLPEARIGVGHGQMDEKQLEQVMLDFIQRKFDVLVCTTIIESGLDIPNANTIVIDDATHLGLAQLYQLRGRVGRSNNRAYAYLLYRQSALLSSDAQQRLEAIAQATELGAGFRIAMKDLEIRGAGNFLGPEQSGHVAAVGLDLYTRLLEQAVREMKTGAAAPEPPAVSIDLPLSASLPSEYVQDLDVRLKLYRRLAHTATRDDLDALQAEVRDRFGPVPQAARNLFTLIRIKLLAAAAGISSVSLVGDEVLLRTTRTAPAGVERAARGVRVLDGQVRLRLRPRKERWVEDLLSLLDQLKPEETAPAALRTGAAAAR